MKYKGKKKFRPRPKVAEVESATIDYRQLKYFNVF